MEPEVESPVKLRRLLLAAALVAAGCGSSNPTPPPSGVAPSASASAAPASAAATPTGSPSAAPVVATVRLALDWTPNTDHTGFVVARAKGWYRDAVIDLRILPYATATPET